MGLSSSYEETMNKVQTWTGELSPTSSTVIQNVFTRGSTLQPRVEVRGELEQRPRSLLQVGEGQQDLTD